MQTAAWTGEKSWRWTVTRGTSHSLEHKGLERAYEDQAESTGSGIIT